MCGQQMSGAGLTVVSVLAWNPRILKLISETFPKNGKVDRDSAALERRGTGLRAGRTLDGGSDARTPMGRPGEVPLTNC